MDEWTAQPFSPGYSPLPSIIWQGTGSTHSYQVEWCCRNRALRLGVFNKRTSSSLYNLCGNKSNLERAVNPSLVMALLCSGWGVWDGGDTHKSRNPAGFQPGNTKNRVLPPSHPTGIFLLWGGKGLPSSLPIPHWCKSHTGANPCSGEKQGKPPDCRD